MTVIQHYIEIKIYTEYILGAQGGKHETIYVAKEIHLIRDFIEILCHGNVIVSVTCFLEYRGFSRQKIT